MTRLAVIDCGTNTFNLLIIELEEGMHYSKLFQTRLAVKLGEHSINLGYISEAAIQRGLDAMAVYKSYCDEYNVKHILAFATSAVRDASNGKAFVDSVVARTNIHIQVIDGNREADLIYLGNKAAVKLTDSPVLIMDIGGGSNEFIIANNSSIFWKGSFNIGAARILEKFPFSDPATAGEIKSLELYLIDQLKELTKAVNQFKPLELIGSSGAFDSFIEMIHGEMGGEALIATKTEYSLDLQQYRLIADRIKKSTRIQREGMKGLIAMRIDMIVISCVMIDMVLKTYSLNKMRVSTFSLKEGALTDYISSLKK